MVHFWCVQRYANKQLLRKMSVFETLMPVNSSVIRGVAYDGSTLAVRFRTRDPVYKHRDVPYAVYAGLMQAPSMGAYYNQHIRGKYK